MGRDALNQTIARDMKRGRRSEVCFKGLAERRGYTVIETSSSSNIHDHIDFILSREDTPDKITVDVKARKKTSRRSDNYDDENVWVEFNNVRGKPGWLYGKANKIAFERAHDFVLVDRESLKDYCEATVSPALLDSPFDALYKSFQRNGRKDVISRVPMKDILHPYSFTIDVEIWKKEVDKAA